MEYIVIITLMALSIKLIWTNIRLEIELKESKKNMMKLCELMMEDEMISTSDKRKILDIYVKLEKEIGED